MPGTPRRSDAAEVRAHVQRHYGIDAQRVRRLSDGDTTVHRIDTAEGGFVLRRHGEHSDREVDSLMRWLHALGGSDVRAPRPSLTNEGGFVADHRTLVSFVAGRRHQRAPRPVHFERIGRTMARLHRHARSWTPPSGFVRNTWTAAEVYCESGLARPPSGDVWALVPPRHRAVFRRAAEHARSSLDDAEQLLIHGDLHLHNVVFADGEACPIDFDDTAFGSVGYDVASALAPHRLESTYAGTLAAFRRGYDSVPDAMDLPSPSGLDRFIVGRVVGLILWCCSMSETIEGFRSALPGWLERYDTRVRALLDES